MEQDEKNLRDELTRGEILLYLRRLYPEGATARTLRYYLDKRYYAVNEENFTFHVQYLADAGFVTYELFEKDLGEHSDIRFVKITKAGIDKVDGRPAGSAGVRF